MDSTELSAVSECQAGNLSAFDQLYLLHVDAIYRFLHRRTLVREIAEDLSSVTFMKAMESIRSFSPARGELRAWLYRIARNSLIDYYRTTRPSVDIDSVWDLPSEDITSLKTEQHLNAAKLHTALSTLTKDQRTIVTLRMWEGLSYREIAELTNKTETNAKVIFSRAITQLRTQLPSLTLLVLFPHIL